MLFSKEDKINMYRKEYGYSEIKKYFPVEKGSFYYLVRILNCYGIACFDRLHHEWIREEKSLCMF